MSDKSSIYDKFAQKFFEQYTTTTFEEVHDSWRHYWPMSGDKVLDVGAGIGRDALYMSETGCDVYALEPSKEMRKLGEAHTGSKVTWISDSLPSLTKIVNLGVRFDVILLSGVWMHVPQSSRARAFRKLSNLLAPNGKLIISLRHGDFSDGRMSYPVSITELEQFAKSSALLMVFASDIENDTLKRADVQWQTAVFSLPDDGTGDLTKIRHIIVNDKKTATYKLALLRTLLRIADAHPGAVMDRHDGKVLIPVGLVALYWIRQFKRLIDKPNIQQLKSSEKNLAFVKDDGWRKITHLVADDLSIGSMFFGKEAIALSNAISDSIDTINAGPVKHTYQGDTSNRYFQIERNRKKKVEQVVLDSDYFASFGTFSLDESLWECLRLYHSWIEPLVVNQWVSEMRSFQLNKDRNISLEKYHEYLVWNDKGHDTKLVRKRVEELNQDINMVESIWSGRKLVGDYHIDHCLPFAYWPNNDRWNLFPVLAKENRSKSDRVPSATRLSQSRGRILNWWELAWGTEQDQSRFFTEASLSLPNIPVACRDFEEVFEAMSLQIKGVKSRLLISDW
ncbi:class I SAM-dependent methyltransferase [Vibrio breoganii]|uniref:class I SAM-dependent methyltransferase n=1 Tax=Vibrio breoganii TaxID=553239 RepID=UPI0021C3CA68|nr:class I SAM-dependent methyltransferase [Vibrio breoganii]MDN3714694.1 class I SAM-dependent methyltransferase [Vibrio breoganii]